jgi:hypothetical protein
METMAFDDISLKLHQESADFFSRYDYQKLSDEVSSWKISDGFALALILRTFVVNTRILYYER